jgi:hypothetical protein
VDWLGHIDFLLRRAHFKGSAEPPKPIPRPGDADGEGDAVVWMDDPEDAQAVLGQDL